MGFAALPTDEQAARLARLAEAALPAWGLAGAGVELVKYRENAVFRVDAADGRRFVLRVHRPRYRSDAHIRSEVAWIGALAREGGVPTPAMLETRAGDVLTRASVDGVPEPRQCDLQVFVEGEPLGTLEGGVALDDAALRATYRTVGEVAARVHAHGATWSKPADFVRPAWDADTLVGESPAFGRFQELDVLSDAQRALLLRARDRARARLHELGPPGALVHGDLIPDNLLAGAGPLRVIDFDDCGWSWLGFELATSLFPLLLSGGFEPGLDGWLEGYRGVRAFPDLELDFMPDFLVARGLSYLGWPVGRPEIQVPRAFCAFMAKEACEMSARYLEGAPVVAAAR